LDHYYTPSQSPPAVWKIAQTTPLVQERRRRAPRVPLSAFRFPAHPLTPAPAHPPLGRILCPSSPRTVTHHAAARARGHTRGTCAQGNGTGVNACTSRDLAGTQCWLFPADVCGRFQGATVLFALQCFAALVLAGMPAYFGLIALVRAQVPAFPLFHCCSCIATN
jgi:hypothetical protein